MPASTPNPALELARAAACCRATESALSRWPGLGADRLVTSLSETLSNRTVGDYDTLIPNTLSTLAHRQICTHLADVESELRQLSGIDSATFRTNDSLLAVLARVDIDVADLSPATLVQHPHPATDAVGRALGLNEMLTWINDGHLAALLMQTYLTTHTSDALDTVITDLVRSGLDAERLCWALITFETTRHVNLVWHFANKMTTTFPERDAADLFGWGWLGLRRALRNFDPSLGYRFSTYAATRITGEIRDGVRSESPVPKRLTTYLRKVVQSEENLTQKLGRIPNLNEVVAHLGDDLSQLSLIPRLAPAASIDELITESEHRGSAEAFCLLDEASNPADATVDSSLAQAVEAALARIPEDERLAVRLLVMEGRDPREVRELTGIDSRRMRRSKERALTALADHLADWAIPSA